MSSRFNDISSTIENRAIRAFKSVSETIENEVRIAIDNDSYWRGFEGSKTRRVNGTKVYGANRNIVDTGELRNSMRTEFSQSSGVHNYRMGFNAKHYQDVRFGTKKVAGRDFVKRGKDRALGMQSIETVIIERMGEN